MAERENVAGNIQMDSEEIESKMHRITPGEDCLSRGPMRTLTPIETIGNCSCNLPVRPL